MKTQFYVKAVKQHDKNYGICALDSGDWFSGFGKLPCKKHDYIEIEFEMNGVWKNITSLNVLHVAQDEPKGLTGSPEPHTAQASHSDRDKFIIRQSCLKAAVEYYGSHGENSDIKKLKEIAEEFENWVLR